VTTNVVRNEIADR